jgi:hypothetical protein
VLWRYRNVETTVAPAGAHSQRDNTLVQPAGWIAELTLLQYWNGSSWIDCADPGQYTFNSTPMSLIGVGWRFSVPPCGSGWYAAQGDGWVWDGSNWQGGGQIGNPNGICIGCGSVPAATSSTAPTASGSTHSRPTRAAQLRKVSKPARPRGRA